MEGTLAQGGPIMAHLPIKASEETSVEHLRKAVGDLHSSLVQYVQAVDMLPLSGPEARTVNIQSQVFQDLEKALQKLLSLTGNLGSIEGSEKEVIVGAQPGHEPNPLWEQFAGEFYKTNVISDTTGRANGIYHVEPSVLAIIIRKTLPDKCEKCGGFFTEIQEPAPFLDVKVYKCCDCEHREYVFAA